MLDDRDDNVLDDTVQGTATWSTSNDSSVNFHMQTYD